MAPRKKLADPDMSLIHPERQAELKLSAQKRVDERRRQKAEEDLLAKLERDYELELNDDPEEEMRTILIDLPGHALSLCIDGRHYHHGGQYQVRRPVFDFLQAQVQSAWRHEDEIGGANRNHYRKPANTVLSGAGMGGNF